MKTRYPGVAATIAALLSYAHAAPAQELPVVAAQPDAAVETELAEVTVTARRRGEAAQDVPLPITVLDADALERSGNFNVIKLQQLTPSLQVYSSNPRNSAANIRGLGAPFGLTNDGIEQGVGQYVDDVYYSRAASSTLDFIDVERIEVLRGPQGTLYGKNTTAGAINITSRAPTFETEGSAEVSAGSYGFYQAKGMLSGPLIDDVLAARVAFSTLNRHGTIDNIATGTKINELDSFGVRTQFLWKAGEDLDVTFTGDWNNQSPEGYAQVSARYGQTQRAANRQYWGLAAIQDTDPVTAGVQPYVAPGSVPGGPGNALSGTFAPFSRVTDVDAPLNAGSELGGLAARAVWDVAGGEFTSVTAWRYWNWLPENDRDFTGLPVTVKSNNPSTQDQYTQEFRFAWTGERIDYVVGLFGYKQTVHTDGIQEQGPAASRWLLNPSGAQAVLSAAPEVINHLTALNDIDFENVSAALFGQLTWRITDSFRLEPGIRINYDDKKGSYDSTIINGQGETLPINPADPFYTSTTPFLLSTGVTTTRGAVRTAQRGVLPPQTYEAQFDDWNVSGGLTAAFDFASSVLGYASYQRGFKTGGITLNGAPTQANGEPIISGTTVDPEEVNHYELGLKTQFANRTVTANLAIFRTDVDDFQATVNNNLGTSTIRGYLANAEQVRVQGVEVDFSWSPSENWRFYVNGAFTDATWESFPDAPCPPELSGGATTSPPAAAAGPPGTAGSVSPANCDISGQWLPGVSRLSGAWGVEYRHLGSILGQPGTLFVAYDGSARSKFSSNPSRSAYTDIAGYGLANFRLGFQSDSTWDVHGWVRNAFSKDYFEILQGSTGGNTGLIAGGLGDPMTYGLTVRVSF